MGCLRKGQSVASRYWKHILLVIFPLVTIPLNFAGSKDKGSRCLYLTANLFFFWCFNIMPAELIGILPIILLPLFGVNSTQEVCSYYLNAETFLLLSSMFVGVAMETTGLNVRIANKILLLMGTSLMKIGGTILFPALLLSMVIPSTLVAILTLSIANATMTTLAQHDLNPRKFLGIPKNLNSAVSLTDLGLPSDIGKEPALEQEPERDLTVRKEEHRKVKICLILCTGYVTLIGNSAMLTSPINHELNDIFHQYYNHTELTPEAWMGCAIPTLLLCAVTIWLYFYWSNIYFSTETSEDDIMDSLKGEISVQRRMEMSEKIVIGTLIILAVALITLDPSFVLGWSFPDKDSIAPATPVALLALLYFAIPAEPASLFQNERFECPGRHRKNIIDYRWAFQSIPWRAFIIQGASNALGNCVKTSGLGTQISDSLPGMVDFSMISLVLIMGVIGGSLSQFLPNNIAIAIILPGIIRLAETKKVNPLFLTIPATLSSTYAFIFPVANHVNSAIFTLAKLKHSEMVRPGLILNSLCFFIVNMMVNTLTIAVFNLYKFPEWAQGTMPH